VVVGVPGRVIIRDGQRVREEVPPDIEAEAMKSMQDQIANLERKIDQLTRLVAAKGENGSAASAPEEPETPRLSDAVDDFLHGAGI
jgi:hypothetical protein